MSPLTLTLCVSVPHHGEAFLALLCESASRLQSHQHTINVCFTCHDEAQQAAIHRLDLTLPIAASFVVAKEPNTYYHANSVTHSRCIQTLFQIDDSDINILCDYDGVFAKKNWDLDLVDLIFQQQIDFVGSPYTTTPFIMPWGPVEANKYQEKPNCIFIAYPTKKITALTKTICTFATLYNDRDSIPLKLISNRSESQCFRLPINTWLSIDTGNKVPEIIEDHQLKFRSLEMRIKTYQVLNPPPRVDETAITTYPEEYFLDDVPFFIHYRKGSAKQLDVQTRWGYEAEDFIRDIKNWLDAIA